MRKIIFLFLLILSFAAKGTVYTPTPGTSPFYTGLLPGDSVLLSGTFTGFTMNNSAGNDTLPIIIINIGGRARIAGPVTLNNSQYFRFTGTGSPDYTYGIRIDSVAGPGIGIAKKSEQYEFDHVEVGGALLPNSKYSINGFGLRHHESPDASDSTAWQQYFTARNIRIHHNYFHHCGAEGLYFGSSKSNGQIITWADTSRTVYPHKNRDVHIHDNIFYYTAWDAFQVSMADSAVYIYNNTVSYSGIEENSIQMIGIVIGGGTENAKVFNNTISNCVGAGMHLFGLNLMVYNNTITNTGITGLDAPGILIGSKYPNELDDPLYDFGGYSTNASGPLSYMYIELNTITDTNGPSIDNNHQYYNPANMHIIQYNMLSSPLAGNYINFQGGVSRNRWILMDNQYRP